MEQPPWAAVAAKAAIRARRPIPRRLGRSEGSRPAREASHALRSLRDFRAFGTRQGLSVNGT